jgi:hypothetical protein
MRLERFICNRCGTRLPFKNIITKYLHLVEVIEELIELSREIYEMDKAPKEIGFIRL